MLPRQYITTIPTVLRFNRLLISSSSILLGAGTRTWIQNSFFASRATSNVFTAQHFSRMVADRWGRFPSPSKKIGHAVVIKGKAHQFTIPHNTATTQIVPLTQIETIQREGLTRYRAMDENNKRFYARRVEQGVLSVDGEEEDFDISYFSEEESEVEEPVWGSSEKISKFTSYAEPCSYVQKGGKLIVNPESVKQRQKQKRNPSQNTVMGQSARDSYEHFGSTFEKDLSPEANDIIQQGYQSNRYDLVYPEWLHGLSFGLTPVAKNPQQKDNLGSAGRWANNDQMALEYLAQWFALYYFGARVELSVIFNMLLDSELINDISMNVKVTVNDGQELRKVEYNRFIDPFSLHPIFRKPTDSGLVTGVTYALLTGQTPHRIENITTEHSSAGDDIIGPSPSNF